MTIEQSDTAFKSFETSLSQKILPLWDQWGWWAEKQRSYEALRTEDLGPHMLYRRSMVLARLLFVYSRAWAHWHTPLHRVRAAAIYQDLTAHFWDEACQGWFFSLNAENKPEKDHKDLYGHAFILFGLSHYLDVFQDQSALSWIQKTHDCLQKNFLLPQGWYAWRADRDWGQKQTALHQNPHMHLLEAYIACAQADSAGGWQQYVQQGYDLFQTHLFDHDLGVLREFYTDQGKIDPETGHIIEPGHHYEWVWLLQIVSDLLGSSPDISSAQARLFDWAQKNGWDRQYGGIYNQVSADGTVLDAEKRIWPLTEYFKAAQIQTGERDQQAIQFFMRHYITDQGSWHEFLQANLTPKPHFLPASTLYHLLNSYIVCQAQS